MKTAKQFAEEYYNLIYNNYGSLQDLEDYFIEYGKQLLIEASKRADFIKLPSISDEDDETIVYDYEIDKNSILNIINELK